MSSQTNKGKFAPPRKLMPGAPLPSLQTRNLEGRAFTLARQQEYSNHLHHYLTDTLSVPGGMRGMHLDKLSSTDDNPHGYLYEIEGTPLWSHGVNPDTKAFFLENLTTQKNFLNCTPADLVTLGNTNAAGGAVLGASGGKASLFGAAPIVQIAGATDVLAGLVSIGMRAASSNPPLNLGTGAVTCGALSASGAITHTGSTAGFFSASPTTQIAGSTDVLSGLVTLGLRAASSNPPLNLGTGALTAGTTSLGATTVGGDLTLSTHNLITDTTTGTKIGTGATQKLGFYGATPTAQIAGSTDVLAGLVSQGLRAASSNPPLDIGTGTLNCGAVIASGTFFMTTVEAQQIIGNSSILRLGYATANFGSPADKTLNAVQYGASFLLVTSGFSMGAPQSIIYPLQQGGFAVIHNGTTGGQAITAISATGTGISIANGKTAMVYCDGTNWLRATPDT